MTMSGTEPQVGQVKTLKVVGVSFIPEYPGNFHAMLEELEARKIDSLDWVSVPDGDGAGMEHYDAADPPSGDQQLSIVLIRNPENEYDENAIQVHVPWLGRRTSMIGHIDRNHAAQLAPRLDAGWEYEGRVLSVDVLPSKPEQPGVTIEIVLKSKTPTDT